MNPKASQNGGTDPWAAFAGMPGKLTRLLDGESDRGAILIVGAYLDEILGLIIRSATVSDGLGAALLEHRQPAGDFSARITLCEAFGLIHADEARALNLIRRIRNDAAHFDSNGRGFDVLFDSERTSGRVRELWTCLNMSHPPTKPEGARDYFIIASRLLATRLYFRGTETRRAPTLLTLKETAARIRESLLSGPDKARVEQLDKLIEEGDIDSLALLAKEMASQMESRVRALRSPNGDGRLPTGQQSPSRPSESKTGATDSTTDKSGN